jgi:phosphoribosylformimino-5-aminoimidazole carboxamide ribotide isomerase
MMQGPNLESTCELAREISIPVIVSGGIRNADDIAACAERSGDGIGGAIVGRALYVGGVSVEEALARIDACS